MESRSQVSNIEGRKEILLQETQYSLMIWLF